MSRQNYYKARKQRQQLQVDGTLIRHLVLEERMMQPRLGGRKLYHLLKTRLAENGIYLGRDRFMKFLAAEGLLVDPLPKGPRTTMSRHSLPVYHNLLKELTLSAPNQAWLSDITYIRCGDGFIYLSLIMDAYSRKVVGYHLGELLTTEETLHALEMALKELPAGVHPIHHSDRGCQYCSHEYTELLAAQGLGISMTEICHCAENAMAERLNGILKQEYGLGCRFLSLADALRCVKQAVHLYNTRRPHTELDMRFPEEVHRQAA